jgi:hypothetical protein
MTLDEYREKYDGLPEFLEAFAEGALMVTNDPEFVSISQQYLVAMENMLDALADREVEVG